MKIDHVIHLAGEQPLPIYIGVMQLDCPYHTIAVTDRTRSVGETLKRVAEESSRRINLLAVDAYDLASVESAIENCIGAARDAAWAINLTGGTKPMFAAAYRVAQRRRLPAFYIETTNRTVDWLDASGRREPLQPSMKTVQEYIRLAGYEMSPDLAMPSPLDSAEGRQLLERMWKRRRNLQDWRRTLNRYAEYKGVPFRDGPRSFKDIKAYAELRGPDEGYRGTLRIGSQEIVLSPWPDLAAYASGLWLEDYLFDKAKTLLQGSKIMDLRKNVMVTVANAESSRQDPFQEFDLALTDGYSLTIVECKAGDIDQGHIQKLENLARRFGGHFGRGILIAGRPDRLRGVRERIEKSPTIAAVTADCAVADPAVLLTLQPGTICMGRPDGKPEQHRR